MSDWSASAAEVLASRVIDHESDRWAHVRAVGRKSRRANVFDPVALDHLVSASWLHDIGYGPTVQRTGFHPLDGATYLADLGLPAQVVSLVAYHTGAEFEAAERDLDVALSHFGRPDARLLDALTYADLSVGPDGRDVMVEERITEILRRYPPANPVNRAVRRSREHLVESARRGSRYFRSADNGAA